MIGFALISYTVGSIIGCCDAFQVCGYTLPHPYTNQPFMDDIVYYILLSILLNIATPLQQLVLYGRYFILYFIKLIVTHCHTLIPSSPLWTILYFIFYLVYGYTLPHPYTIQHFMDDFLYKFKKEKLKNLWVW